MRYENLTGVVRPHTRGRIDLHAHPKELVR
jgi:hypothetical protein